MRMNLDVMHNQVVENDSDLIVVSVGVAVCERIEALTAALERVADYVGEYGIPDGTGRNLRYYAEDRKACATNPRAEGDVDHG